MNLADEIEGAEGPSRELDEAIAMLCEPGMFCRDEHGRLRKNIHGTALNPQWNLWGAPAYTSSIDAAMTLVPEGWDWLRLDFRTMTCVRPNGDDEWATHVDGRGTTPALALCAAALRARGEG